MNKTSYSTNVLNNKRESNLLNTSLVNSRAKIESSNGKIYVVIDGHRIEADRNDLFGMNKSNPNEWLEHLVELYDKEMAKNEEKISFLEKQENAIKSALKKAKEAFWSFLARLGVSRIDQIADESERAQAKLLYNKEIDLTFEKTSVNNQLHSALLDNFLAACDKGKYSNQIAVNNALLSRMN